jgi:hypothetical protein
MEPLGMEYDGEVHCSATAHGRDLDRDGALDWDVIPVTGRQMADLDAVARRRLHKLGH